MTDATDFPLDWNEWCKEWHHWKNDHQSVLKDTRHRFEGKNFLATDILGTWKVNGRIVELSEVTFPDFRRDPATGRLPYNDRRGIGLTFTDDSGTVVHSFTELESALGMTGS